MAKKYSFNMERNQHNVEHALTMLRNRIADAEEQGNDARANDLRAKHARLYSAYEAAGFCGGMAKVEWKHWQVLDAACKWAIGCRAVACEAAGL